jgi:hypothetical protein
VRSAAENDHHGGACARERLSRRALAEGRSDFDNDQWRGRLQGEFTAATLKLSPNHVLKNHPADECDRASESPSG